MIPHSQQQWQRCSAEGDAPRDCSGFRNVIGGNNSHLRSECPDRFQIIYAGIALIERLIINAHNMALLFKECCDIAQRQRWRCVRFVKAGKRNQSDLHGFLNRSQATSHRRITSSQKRL
jgi:hypothetical protein